MWRRSERLTGLFVLSAGIALAALGDDIQYARTGKVEPDHLDELSGLQASRDHPGVLWVHNDDGAANVYAVDATGRLLGTVRIDAASNQDWEDIALLPEPGQDLLVLADLGDNELRREHGLLYFVPEPAPDAGGAFTGRASARHVLRLTYPDGPHDVESVAFDPLDKRLLMVDKRSTPPRIFGLAVDQALASGEARVTLLGEMAHLRPPQAGDAQRFGKRTRWISQPTGMDIAPDGRRAAVITYRSLYLFELGDHMDWAEALQDAAMEIIGPPATHEEAVSFTAGGRELIVTSEGVNAPVYTYRLGSQ